jgi:uncharacterized protein YjiS (DUF1127 family)
MVKQAQGTTAQRTQAGEGVPNFGALVDGLAGRLQGVAARCARKAMDHIAIWHDRRMLEEELGGMDDRTLAEIGLMRSQIPLLAKAYPASVQQLTQVLIRLGLDTKEVPLDPATRGDLYRNCTMCSKRRRCRRWLGSAKGSEGYPAFCPNAWMFSRLLEARRACPAAPNG